MAAEVGLPKENFLKQSEEKLKNGYVHKGMNLNDLYNEQSCEYKINSFPPQLRKPAWLMYGIKWMKIKMFLKMDS